mmetsp:Transcript_8270/g.20902  ORF Transcript_8270/g.20902 Transcript_8270/m.20902 type:complete len:226 (-) Transcript_8270:721-1398(-)
MLFCSSQSSFTRSTVLPSVLTLSKGFNFFQSGLGVIERRSSSSLGRPAIFLLSSSMVLRAEECSSRDTELLLTSRSFSRSTSARTSSFWVSSEVCRSLSSSSASTCCMWPAARMRCMSSLERSSSLRSRFSSSRELRTSALLVAARSFASSSLAARSLFMSSDSCTCSSSVRILSSILKTSRSLSRSSALQRPCSSTILAFSASSRSTTVKNGSWSKASVPVSDW